MVADLESARKTIADLRDVIVSLAPAEYTEVLESYRACQSTREFHRWQDEVAEKIAQSIPEESITNFGPQRANCPLCRRSTLGPFSIGFTIPLGLIRHLTGFGNVNQCDVTQAAFDLGRDYIERHYGEAERAAKKAEDEEKARRTEARRQTETLYKIHPNDPPLLIDEGFRSWFEDHRTAERFVWAEARVKSLGFIKHQEDRALSFTKDATDSVIYADIRFEKRISFEVFRLPLPKRKKPQSMSFALPDHFKNEIEEKFDKRLEEALARLGITNLKGGRIPPSCP